MEVFNMNNNVNQNIELHSDPIKDYLKLIRINWVKLTIITAVFFSTAVLYSLSLEDKYKSTTTLRISDPSKNFLKSTIEDDRNTFIGKDRFIANEIQTMSNVTIQKMVGQIIMDSLHNIKNNHDISVKENKPGNLFVNFTSEDAVMQAVWSSVEISQPADLDFIEITAESTSPHEAALIANSYAEAYRRFNLLDSRKQFANIKNFLLEQAEEKKNQLIEAENNIKVYKMKGGVVELDKQSSSLVENLAGFEAKRNAAKIEVAMLEDRLSNLKTELNKKDPSLSEYLESKTTEPYLQILQKQIAQVEAQKDIALANKNNYADPAAMKQYESTLKELKNKLKSSTEEYQKVILSSSPEEIKDLMKKIFEDEVTYNSISASYKQMNNVISSYESRFNSLPAKAIELARLERERMSLEGLYTILVEKYQEALVNEQATPGNVLVLSNAVPSSSPSGPNRPFISILGLILGVGISFTFIFFKSYFDVTVMSPDDILGKNLHMLSWIPKVKFDNKNGYEISVLKNPKSVIAEAFSTLRTRLQFSRVINEAKVVLVTSSAPQEGKTFVSVNLGASFANINSKVLIMDLDLRNPTVHKYFNEKKSPGLVDYFLGETHYEQILRRTEHPSLYYIPAGKTPPNPAEILSSARMKSFMQKLRGEFDLILVDTTPIMAVADAEITLNLVDLSLLVVSANSTKMDWMMESLSIINLNKNHKFLGVLLNSFNNKLSGYKSNYKYYNYYSQKSFEKNKKVI